jgi:hypothetical protein
MTAILMASVKRGYASVTMDLRGHIVKSPSVRKIVTTKEYVIKASAIA